MALNQDNNAPALPALGCDRHPDEERVMTDPLATSISDYAHRVAVYDMDRTITRSGTYSGFLIHVARRRQQWRLLFLPLVGLAGAVYSLRLIDRSRLKAINLRPLVGKSFRRDRKRTRLNSSP